MIKQLPLVFLAFTFYASAHPGRLDHSGGHTNSSSGKYHCHQAPCTTTHRKVEEATLEAIQEQRPVSFLYSREDWKHWIDADRDCMNTRHEMLQAQAIGEVRLSPDGCFVSVGTWHDPYSGKTYTRASDLDIDHIIPLKWAHEHGGARWTPQEKEAFANDFRNLLAVDDGLNQQKGAQGPTEWMPPNQAYRCDYLAHWQRILMLYPSLSMTASEARIFKRQHAACGAQ